MNKEKYFIDLSKCSDEQHREVISLVKNNMEKTAVILDILLFNESQNLWCTFDKYGGAKQELTYPEFIKFFEGEDDYPGKRCQPLFDYLNQEHGLILHESEMDEIIRIVIGLNSNQ